LNLQFQMNQIFSTNTSFIVADLSLSATKIEVLKNGGVLFNIDSTILSESITADNFARVLDFNINNNVNINVISGDVISFRMVFGNVALNISGGGFVIVEASSTGVPITLDMTSANGSITDGGTVKIWRYLPIMKCSDLLLSAIRQFNLYISEQSNDGVVKIESLMPFYSNTNDFNDISELVDTTKPIVIKPAANEYPKNIIFTFKKATDFDNMRYLDKYEEEYGDMKFVQGSYYSKGDQKTELAWGTIVPFQISGTIVVPRFIKIENNIAKPNAGPGRIMFRNGLKSGSWTFNDTVGLGGEFLTTYPCVHHFDNWQNPTMDLNFKLVNEVYYTSTNALKSTPVSSFSLTTIL